MVWLAWCCLQLKPAKASRRVVEYADTSEATHEINGAYALL